MTNNNFEDLGDKIPLFLRKTYNMINACDDSIATWSEDGLSFAVKDIDLFASNILCKYFKHNKFSSFVRQLNLYGFRKVKSTDSDWIFKHEYFQRKRPDLLPQIRKASQPHESADKSEVERLRTEVGDLRTTLATMSAQLGDLSKLLTSIAMTNSQPLQPAAVYNMPPMITASAGSKRNLDATVVPQQMTYVPPLPGYNLASTAPPPMKKQRFVSPVTCTNFSSSASSNISCVSCDSSCSSGTSEFEAQTPMGDEFGLDSTETTVSPLIQDIRKIEMMHFDADCSVYPNTEGLNFPSQTLAHPC